MIKNQSLTLEQRASKRAELGQAMAGHFSVVSNNDCFNENSIYEHYDHFCSLLLNSM